MDSKNKGLTVGELTMAIGALVLAGLIWSSFNSQKDSREQALSTSYELVGS